MPPLRNLLPRICLAVALLAALGCRQPEPPATAISPTATPAPVPTPASTPTPEPYLRAPVLPPAPKEPITFGNPNWNSAQLQTRIAQYIVEKGYGYSTSVQFGAASPLFYFMLGDDIDVLMEVWLPNQSEIWPEATQAGEVISLGESLGRDWQSAFVIPAYLQEQYPELDHIADLRNPFYQALFATPETAGKARLVSCVIGWPCAEVNAAQVYGYGLADHIQIVHPADAAALNADLHDAYARRQPWLGYQWGTNDPPLLLDLVRLEEPAYRDSCWLTTRACAYPDATILIGVNAELPDRAPEIAAMLRKWEFNIDTALKPATRWQRANPQADLNDTALWWLNNYPTLWREWVTPEAAAKITAALAAGETAAGWPEP